MVGWGLGVSSQGPLVFWFLGVGVLRLCTLPDYHICIVEVPALQSMKQTQTAANTQPASVVLYWQCLLQDVSSLLIEKLCYIHLLHYKFYGNV